MKETDSFFERHRKLSVFDLCEQGAKVQDLELHESLTAAEMVRIDPLDQLLMCNATGQMVCYG